MAEGVAIDFRVTGVEGVKQAFSTVQNAFKALQGRGPKEAQGLMATLSNIGNFITGIKSTVDFVEQKIGQVVGLIRGLASTTMELAALGGEAMGVERAFEGLTKRAGESADVMLTKVRAALNETVSDTEIMRNINIALQLGLPATADEMSKLADVAQRLGRAVGRGPTLAFQDLVTGIGRQSRLILDNLGIVVNSEQAYEKYAKSLNKTVEDLDDAEKKQAFFNEVMLKATDIVGAMGDEQLTATDNIATMTAAWDNLKSEIGELIATSPGFKALMEGIRNLIKRIVVFVSENAGFITAFLNDVFGLVQQLAEFFITVLIPVLKMIMVIARAVLSVVNPLLKGITQLVSLFFGGGGTPSVPETAGMMVPGMLFPGMGMAGAIAGGGTKPNINVTVNAGGVSSREAVDRAFDDAKKQVFSQMDDMDREIRRQGRVMEQESKNKMYTT